MAPALHRRLRGGGAQRHRRVQEDHGSVQGDVPEVGHAAGPEQGGGTQHGADLPGNRDRLGQAGGEAASGEIVRVKQPPGEMEGNEIVQEEGLGVAGGVPQPRMQGGAARQVVQEEAPGLAIHREAWRAESETQRGGEGRH